MYRRRWGEYARLEIHFMFYDTDAVHAGER